MISATLSLVSGLLLLVAGAELLVRGSAAIALRLGITPLVIGLTVVAFGTGSPELSVSVGAALRGNSGIALGNVVGSNISNIALILGLSALARPMRVRSEVIRREVPLMIAVTVLLCALLLDGLLTRFDGALLLTGMIAYIVFAYTTGRREGKAKDVADSEGLPLLPDQGIVWLDVVFVVGGIATLLLGAKLLLLGATFVAVRFGLSDVVIGLTVVAIGTSLPELATSVVAAVRGHADVAFGNVIGSNVLNILCVLGVTALVRPFGTDGLTLTDVVVLVGTALLILPLMWRGAVLNRSEGAFLLLGYAAYMYAVLT
jgi:cation:H+ antiporter